MRAVRPWWAGLAPWDRRLAVAWFAVPLLFFVIPALAGHPFMAGDGVGQNYPLRSLVGTDIRHGHLPLWNPYIWSGTPLLSGFNAGALFPASLLFAVMPGPIAWSIVEGLVFTVAGLGLYTFLRLHRLTPVASMAGAVTWCGFGFIGSQLVHLASAQGWGLVTWLLVAARMIAVGPRERRAQWSALFGAALGLMILAGDPESMVEGSMLAGVYLLSLLWRYRDARILAWVVTGVAGAMAVGAVQWLPGLALAQASQRSQASFEFFVGGSVGGANIPLLFVPYLLGGFGHFGVPYYFGSYSLVELSGYAGIVATSAVFSLGALWRRDPGARDWRPWYVIGAIGMVLSMGLYTPVAHIMFHVPLYRLLRLPSRNLAWVDLAAAILCGFWVDRMLVARFGRTEARAGRTMVSTWHGDDVGGGSTAVGGGSAAVGGGSTAVGGGSTAVGGGSTAVGGGNARNPMATVLALVPAGVVCVSLISLIVAGSTMISTLAVAPPAEASDHLRALEIVTAFQLVIAGCFAVLVLRSKRWARRRAVVALLCVIGADLAFYSLNQEWFQGPSTHLVDTATPESRSLSTFLAMSGGGRFAIFDPNRYHSDQLDKIGQPDINVVTRTPSVQGYGSIAPAVYAAATGTHQQLTVEVPALRDGTFRTLGLTVLLAPYQYFATVTAKPAPAPGGPGHGDQYAFPPAPPPGNEPPAVEAWGQIGPGDAGRWFWGKSADVATLDMDVVEPAAALLSNPSSGASSTIQIGLVESGGSIRWLRPGDATFRTVATSARRTKGTLAAGSPVPASRDGAVPQSGEVNEHLTVQLGKARAGVGLAVRNSGSGNVTVSGIEYSDAAGYHYRLTGALSQAVAPGAWTYVGSIDDYSVFSDSDAARSDHLRSPSDGSVETFPPDAWGTQNFVVDARTSTTLTRSESYLPGWVAQLTPARGTSGQPVGARVHRATARRAGLVQAVSIPRGRWLVTFSYHPPRVAAGLVTTFAGIGALIVLVAISRLGWNRSRLGGLRRGRAVVVTSDPGADGAPGWRV